VDPDADNVRVSQIRHLTSLVVGAPARWRLQLASRLQDSSFLGVPLSLSAVKGSRPWAVVRRRLEDVGLRVAMAVAMAMGVADVEGRQGRPGGHGPMKEVGVRRCPRGPL